METESTPDTRLDPEVAAPRVPVSLSDDVREQVASTAPAGGADPATEALWMSAAMLWGQRRFLVVWFVLSSLVAIAVTLLLPNQYRASARVLAPEQGNTGLLGMLRAPGGGSAARLLGDLAGGGDYARYFAILTSRSVADAAIDSFALMRVYKTADKAFPRDATYRELEERAAFALDEEYEYLTISVLDESPSRAAAMANFFVRELNRRHQRLQTQSATLYRELLERRYRAANLAIDSLLDATKQFQQQSGVFDLPAQTQAFYEQVAALRAEVARIEVQYEAARAEYGESHPTVTGLQSALQAAQAQYQRALSGSEAAFPVSRQRAPEVARQYAMLERERMLQTGIMEALAPMYEASRLEEARQVEALQVLDTATPPERKAEPKRSLLVIASVAASMLIVILALLGRLLWERQREAIGARLATPR